MNHNKMELVSIVVPIYNVEQYLRKCLDSICGQTYENLEIILVDDGSTDASYKIIEEYNQKDNRVRAFHKENGGLSSARNYGIDRSKGTYICFVDSDDWIHPDFVGSLINAIADDKSEIAVCNMAYVFSDGARRNRTPYLRERKVVNNLDALSDLFTSKGFRFHAVNKMYKRELFVKKKIRYPEGQIYEDISTTYKLMFFANKISYVPYEGYYYLQSRPGSILDTRFDDRRFIVIDIMKDIEAFCKEKNIGLTKQYEALCVMNIVSLANYLTPVYAYLSTDLKKNYRAKLTSAKEILNVGNHFNNRWLSPEIKVRYFLINKCFPIYSCLLNLLKRNHK